MGGLLQGFDVSSMSVMLANAQYKDYFCHPGSVQQGGITASVSGGSLLGAFLAGWSGDWIGRRDSMAAACIVFILGSSLMSAAQNIAMLIIARLINGFAVGLLTSQCPIYIAEISPPSKRGKLIALQQWMITWGILIMYLISYGTSFIDSTAMFRIPWSVQIIPAIILLIFIPFMPRSPRWLAKNDRWEEASSTLADLRSEGNQSNSDVVAEIHEIRERIEMEMQFVSNSWLELFRSRNFIRVHVGIFAHIWAQYSGINALMYYIVYVFEMAGLSGKTNITIAIIQYVIMIVMTIPALLFIDRFPRRGVMICGSIFMAISLYTTGAVMAAKGHAIPGGLKASPTVTWVVEGEAPSKVIIACSYVFVATFACTWGPMGWIYPSEIIPLYIRSKAVSLANLFNWACTFSLTFFTPPAFQNIQWRTYMIFGSFCVAASFHVFFFFQESRCQTLEEMSFIFENNTFACGKIEKPKIQFLDRLDQFEGEKGACEPSLHGTFEGEVA